MREKVYNWRKSKILVRDVKTNEVRVFSNVENAAVWCGFSIGYIQLLVRKGKLLNKHYEFTAKEGIEETPKSLLDDIKASISRLEATIK